MSETIQVLTKTPDGPWTAQPVTNTLPALQTLVGGFVEPVILPVGDEEWILWCNAEGKVDALPWNDGATQLLRQAWNGERSDPIAGPVFVTRDYDDEGALVGLADADVLTFSEQFDVAIVSTDPLAASPRAAQGGPR